MIDLDALADKHTSDHEVSVAFAWMPLRTHKSHSVVSSARDQAVNPGAEKFSSGDSVVEDATIVVVEPTTGRSTAEFLPEKDIANPAFSEQLLQRLLTEMRRVLRVGRCPHVRDHVDAGVRCETQECVGVMVGVPNGEKRGQLLFTPQIA